MKRGVRIMTEKCKLRPKSRGMSVCLSVVIAHRQKLTSSVGFGAVGIQIVCRDSAGYRTATLAAMFHDYLGSILSNPLMFLRGFHCTELYLNASRRHSACAACTVSKCTVQRMGKNNFNTCRLNQTVSQYCRFFKFRAKDEN